MQKLTQKEYAGLVKKSSPKSRVFVSVLGAFLIGGLICVIGEGFANLYAARGMEQEAAYGATAVTLIFIAALLTGLNLYSYIAKVGGAGSLVPISGFSNAITSAAMEFKDEGYILGVGAKLFAVAGPVIVYGYSAGILYGIIIYLFRLY
jgi:stage V sporulation protein AC